MTQSRIDSAMETVTNTAIGYVIAVVANAVILPATLGIEVSMGDNLLIAALFTVISLIRGYLIRRMFNGRSVWQAVKNWWNEGLWPRGECAWCDYERDGR